MKDNRILLYTDRSAVKKLQKDCIEVAEACSSLVEIFESFQEWKKITTLDEWLALVNDPGEYFDSVLLENVNMSAGLRKADPEAAAKLFNVDRDNYLNMVAGKSVTDPGCVPCKKMKVRKGTSVISINHYRQFESFLIFNSGYFTVNEETIAMKQEDFKVFASSAKQLSYFKHFGDLARILNEHIELNKLSLTQIEQLKSMTGLLIADNKLIVDDRKIAETIKYMK